jgi:hypothetical protein
VSQCVDKIKEYHYINIINISSLYKKQISILLILLLIFNSCGFVIAFFQMEFIFKNIAYEKISNILPEDQLTVLKISKAEINDENVFVEFEETEISYYDKMYDICKKDTIGNDIIFYCYSDENEDILQSAFTSFIKQHTNPNSNNPVTNLIKQLIKIAYFSDYHYNHFNNSTDEYASYSDINYSGISLEVLTPPPKYI